MFSGSLKLILSGHMKPNEKFLEGISNEFNAPYETLDKVLRGEIPAPKVEVVKPKTEP